MWTVDLWAATASPSRGVEIWRYVEVKITINDINDIEIRPSVVQLQQPTMTLPPLANLSLWQRTVRDHPLLNGTHASPPAKADVVVIGGGLCGAVIAYHLLTDNSASQAPSVVVLEARELASGASGRNAGHCRPDPARGFTGFEKLHGAQQARAICESEAVALERYVHSLPPPPTPLLSP
jgi:hypothetical protein